MSHITGLRDWIIQRVTALYMACYIVFFFVTLICQSPVNFASWKHLFGVFWFQGLTILFLVCLLWHAWIGLWTVMTDYIKCGCLRAGVSLLVIAALIAYLVWGIEVVWAIGF